MKDNLTMEELKYSHSLTKLNTLQLKSNTKYFIQLNTIDQIPGIIKFILKENLKFFVLGGGSNLLLPSIYNGLVIYNQLKGIEKLTTFTDSVLIKAMAATNWDQFVEFTLEHGWFGLENLSLIPGTVGAAPIQNIGAYGVEVKDFIEYVEVFDIINQAFLNIPREKCNFSYRNSYFKNNSNYIVIAVIFRLSFKPQLNINYADLHKHLADATDLTPLKLRQTVIKIRQNKLPDPKLIANVGSFFHNPILADEIVKNLLVKYPDIPVYKVDDHQFKISAGWLIDHLGLKGYKLGNIAVYDKQALVLINYGGADQKELLNFAKNIQNKVFDNYKIKLVIEPIIIK